MVKTMRLHYSHIADAYNVLAKVLAPNYYSSLLPEGFQWKLGRVSRHKDHYHLVVIGWTKRRRNHGRYLKDNRKVLC